nr:acyl-CoA dehydrogenase [Desulfuromonadales bacterium]NIS42333.1 acyl-CoA dehydrogenase [Desulfuromonadales bacterium]
RTNDPSEERPEITAFVVEGNADGLSTAHRCDFMGLKGLQNGLLSFDNVKVPKENIVEGLGRGLALALRTLNTGRLTLPAACGGALKHALEIVIDWCNDRSQWGASIGHHEAVAHRTATLAAEIYAVEAITWLTSAMADAGKNDIRLEAAMAKLFCTEALWRGVDAALATRGGRGYETADSLAGRGEKPMPMERLLRDARINLIIEGTSDIMRLFIAREALDPHLKVAGASATSDKVDFVGAAKFYAKWYPGLWVPSSMNIDVDLPHRLSRHLRYVERASRRLARDLFHMIGLHRQGLQRKQQILGRIVDTGAELFAMMATLSYTATKSAPDNAEELADLFCRQSRRRVNAMHRAIYRNDDVFAYRTARKIHDGEFGWLDDNIVTTWRKED